MGTANPVDALFGALYQGIGHGYIEIRGKEWPEQDGHLKYREWFLWPGDLPKIVPAITPHIGKLNLWYGVGLRRDRGGGTKADVTFLPGIWCDIDYKTTPPDVAAKRLAEFPIKPSITIRSGGGIHAYWLGKEPIWESQFPLAEATMKALARALGGDEKACGAHGLLRIPTTANIKYTPPVTVEIIDGPHENRRYTLDEFGDLLVVEEPKPPPANAKAGQREMPSRELPPEMAQRAAELLTGIWLDSYRHNLALLFAGVMAHAGYSEASSVRVIEGICTFAGDKEVADRVGCVRDTYKKFAAGMPVAGQPTLEEMIEQFPGIIRDKAKKLYDAFKKSIPKPPKPGKKQVEPNFEIIRVIKFDSRPARYSVLIKHEDGKQYTVTCETATCMTIWPFRVAFFEATPNRTLAPISQETWEAMLANAPIEVKAAPVEATVCGAIETELVSFLEDRRETTDLSTLRGFAGYDADHVYFILNTFKEHLREKGVKVADREVIHVLKDLGWEPDKRRLGERSVRLWMRPHENGRGKIHENGHPTPPQGDLFGPPELSF